MKLNIDLWDIALGLTLVFTIIFQASIGLYEYPVQADSVTDILVRKYAIDEKQLRSDLMQKLSADSFRRTIVFMLPMLLSLLVFILGLQRRCARFAKAKQPLITGKLIDEG
jgi:hypothetical protein